MDELFSKYQKLVYKIANKYPYYDREDLYQAGMVGLKEALLHYDKKKESDLVSYVCFYIKGEVLKEINNNKEVKVSRNTYKLQQDVKSAEDFLAQSIGRNPSYSELAYYLNLDVETISFIKTLQEPVYHLDDEKDEEVSLYDKIAHIETSYDAGIMDLKTACCMLDLKEQELIKKRYYQDQTQSEIAKDLGLSQVQVSRSEKKILQKLKSSLV